MPSSKSGPGSRSGAPPKPDTPKAGRAQAPQGSVYFEFVAAGASARVTAIDEKTGAEATIIGPARSGRAVLERAALAKLRYVLNRVK